MKKFFGTWSILASNISVEAGAGAFKSNLFGIAIAWRHNLPPLYALQYPFCSLFCSTKEIKVNESSISVWKDISPCFNYPPGASTLLKISVLSATIKVRQICLRQESCSKHIRKLQRCKKNITCEQPCTRGFNVAENQCVQCNYLA